MRLVTRGTALWGIVALVLAVWACETTRNPGGIQHDVISPVITLSNTAGDTQQIAGGLRFTVSAAETVNRRPPAICCVSPAVLESVMTGEITSC